MRKISVVFVVLGLGLMGAGQIDPLPGTPGFLAVSKTAHYDARDALADMPPVPKACMRRGGRNVCRAALIIIDGCPGGLELAAVWGPPKSGYFCFDRRNPDLFEPTNAAGACDKKDEVIGLVSRPTLKEFKREAKMMPGCNARGTPPK